LPKGKKLIGCKWVFKTNEIRKATSKDKRNVLSQRDSLKEIALTIRRPSSDFHEGGSFRIIMAPMAHFYLELHQIDIKIVFLNGDIEEKSILCNQTILKSKVCNI